MTLQVARAASAPLIAPAEIALLTGVTSWTTAALPAAGLRPMVLSDGPIGVRGVDEDDRPSAQLPSPSALAATWDRKLLGELGLLLGREARRKDVDIVLAPVVNLQRTPFGGRHFEMFSEDPLLTGVLATSMITATQSLGVAMCVKHFLGNESETDRTTYLARMDERAMREVYLAPFQRAVEAGVWTVMAAYNGVDDGVEAAPATEHGRLLTSLLKAEWGFDGVVISDWLATKSTVPSAVGGLDLVMPGPGGPWGAALEEAVEAGSVPAAIVKDKVDRVVRLGRRVGAVTGHEAPATGWTEPDSTSTRTLLRRVVAASSVVLRNEGVLPLGRDVRRVAVIGPNAVEPFVQGGGSASVTAVLQSSPIDALRDALPRAEITLHRGSPSRRHAHPIDPHLVTTPSGEPGYLLTFFDVDGREIEPSRVVAADETWNRDAPDGAVRARIRANVHLAAGAHVVEVGVSGSHVIRFDGEVVSESTREADHDVILDSSANNPDGPVRRFEQAEDRVVRIAAVQQVVDAGAYGRFVRFVLRHDCDSVATSSELQDALDAAADAEVAIVVVGTNEESESEGWDRTSLGLPGFQDDLVRRVAAVNPNTVVVVNAGAPVVLPWLDEVAAVLWWWLPGQEAGTGLAAALLGETEPSGRLPWTLPASEEDVPVRDVVPKHGTIDYIEGLHVGYRQWDRDGRTPARPFGFGLGYGAWRYDELVISGDITGCTARVTVTNIGSRTARETVQLYLEAPESTIERPARWLAGFAGLAVPPGETGVVEIEIERRAFEIWDPAGATWALPKTLYRLHAGHDSRDLRRSVVVPPLQTS
ncbi:beta-glucosidase family protein [Amnibacterium kyonggiense]|uniref:Beta-glucosidase n=1 Tax=Amnibacterium kyonggiense TaxID=595671 RepID=A0A4V3EB50_9MICO|nr:glycoside hydrolase family 3 C-terminal domain-containing protein [Amnibacterium kyonggiense]TDS80324.1 beta-glucosidase [Amnibacterium kyonggiense]